VALAKRRYQWLANLENQVQQIAEQFRQDQISLPAVITIQHLEQAEALTFRVWDKLSWLKAHQAAYGARVERRHRRRPDMDPQLFLQLEGHIPDGSWFLPAVAVGVIQGSQQLGPQARHYADQWQLPKLNVSSPGLLTPGAFGRFLWITRDRATGLPDDSKVIFCVEPLLAAATVGLFVLVSIVSTGMRVGELQQVTYDQECMERGYLPQFDDQTKQWVRGPERTFLRVYPKGGQRRERYFASATVLETLLALYDLHRRYHGPNERIPAQPTQAQFSHTRRYPERYRFVLQWAGVHLASHTLNNCLTFLLLEHPCRDQAGQPVHITPHLLRHAVAGWLHREEFSLDQIMGVLKHINGAVTAYYAALSPDELYRKLGPLLTSLAELIDLDPAVVRSGEQLRALQEQALKRYGLLRQIPGGTCTTLYPCEVHFKCADCRYYIPDPARRGDIEQVVATGTEIIQIYRHQGEHLLAEAECARQSSWQRVLTEMDQIEECRLMSPQMVANRMCTFPVNDVGPKLLQDSDPLQRLEE
jgi:integrase